VLPVVIGHTDHSYNTDSIPKPLPHAAGQVKLSLQFMVICLSYYSTEMKFSASVRKSVT
jgi:hypothetical protein